MTTGAPASSRTTMSNSPRGVRPSKTVSAAMSEAVARMRGSLRAPSGRDSGLGRGGAGNAPRRHDVVGLLAGEHHVELRARKPFDLGRCLQSLGLTRELRSEEHTSELQSPM